MSRRRKILKSKFIDEVMIVGVVAGGVYLILDYLVGTASSTATLAAVALGGVLVGLYLRPWADRVARRFGVRIVRARGRRR